MDLIFHLKTSKKHPEKHKQLKNRKLKNYKEDHFSEKRNKLKSYK